MSDRPYLSIGEVLALLLEEFPDVTISKIRFLESQGLIEPERTPSGYRKFFDDDVELLRVILREQREKFLPLRVIKDRIDSGEIETGDPTPPRGATSSPSSPSSAASAPAAPGASTPRGGVPARSISPEWMRSLITRRGRKFWRCSRRMTRRRSTSCSRNLR